MGGTSIESIVPLPLEPGLIPVQANVMEFLDFFVKVVC